jgi:putative redox protein
MVKIELERVNGDYGFEAKDQSGHIVKTDTSPDGGGEDFGVRPMQMLLMALGSCSGIDIVMILNKQRQEINAFSMKIEAERESGKTPALWKNIHINFMLKGDISPEKAQRACELSINKYCSVAETLRLAGCKISWEVKVENKIQ